MNNVMKFNKIIVAVFASFVSVGSAIAQDKCIITIKAEKPGAPIQPTMWGVFFEDINMGADGGIYAELIKNRSFEFNKPLMGWKVEQKPFVEGNLTIINRPENLSNPRFLRLKLANAVKITNEGFRGMGFKKDLDYHFSFLYRSGSTDMRIHIELLNAKNE